MKKEELRAIVEEYGDAVITYRSKNSRKLKYNVCTLNFNNKHIQSKRNRAKEAEDTLLLFCWDTDSYRLLLPTNVTRVDSLSSVLKNENV
jgi:hypothetical protein